jgi:hypothetical protein
LAYCSNAGSQDFFHQAAKGGLVFFFPAMKKQQKVFKLLKLRKKRVAQLNLFDPVRLG